MKNSLGFNSALLENAPNPILVINPDTSIRYINPAFEKLTGFSSSELIGRKFPYPYWLENGASDLRAALETSMSGIGMTRNERTFKNKSGQLFCVETTSMPMRDSEGKLRCQIINWVDITERKRAEEKLKESDEFSTSLLINAPNPIIVSDPDTSIRYINPAFEKLTGYSRAEVIGSRIPYPWWPEKKLNEHNELNERRKFEDVHSLERCGLKKDGTPFWISLNRSVIKEDGKIKYFLGNWVDITERKKAEEFLKASEKNFQDSLDNSPLGIRISDQEGNFLYANRVLLDLFGCRDIDELRAIPVEDRLTPESYAAHLDRIQRHQNGKHVPSDFEISIVRKDNGDIRHLAVSRGEVLWNNTKRFQLIYQDITERKELEQLLLKEKDQAKKLLDIAGVMIIALDVEGKVTLVNAKTIEILGYRRDEIISKNWAETFLPERFRKKLKADFNRFISGDIGPVEYVENKVLTRHGQERMIAWHNAAIRDERGHVIGTLSSGEDITEIKKAEKSLRESEERYRSLFKNMINGYAFCKILVDEENKPVDFLYIDVNDAFEKITGLRKKEVVSKRVTEVIPSIKDLNPEIIPVYGEVATTGRPAAFEVFLKPLDVWLAISVYSPRKDYFVAVFDNITERKLAEKEMGKYRLLIEAMLDGFVRVAMNGLILESNESYKNMLGYSDQELSTLTYSDITPPKWHNMEAKIVEDQVLKRGYSDVYQKEYQRKDGTIVPIELRTYLVRDVYGLPLEMWAIIRDITGRKRAEEALKQSQDQLRQFSIYLQEQLETERKRLAAEIHDELGQMLTGLKIDLFWLSRKLPEGNEPLLQKTRSMLDTVDEIDNIAKKIAADLRPTILDDLGLSAAMKWLAQQFKARTGIQCVMVITPEDLVLEKHLSVDVFRIVQEALTNISRHAGATEVRVLLKVRGRIVVVNISDNGRGVTREEIVDPGSFGLIGMKERARRWDGTLDINGIPGKGTTIKMSLRLGEAK